MANSRSRWKGVPPAVVTLSLAMASACVGLERTGGTSPEAATTTGPSQGTSTSAPADPGTTTGAAPSGSTTGGLQEPPPDVAHPTCGARNSQECDVWTQDCGCGDKCMPWSDYEGASWNAVRCTPVAAEPKLPGEPCTVEDSPMSGVDDCVAGAMCWRVDPETLEGVCVAFCGGYETEPECAEPGTTCVVANSGVLILCLPTCDPLLAACPAGDVCVPNPSGDDFVCVLGWPSEYQVPAGEPCVCINGCRPGLACVDDEAVPGCAGNQACCAPFCDLTDPTADVACSEAFAAPGAVCVPYYAEGAAPAGFEDVGLCLLPPDAPGEGTGP